MNFFLIFCALILLFFSNNVYSTSTAFEQNLILNDTINPLKVNPESSGLNIQTVALTGSVGYFGKKLYESGFFSPFGLVPGQISKLSPLAYKSKIITQESYKINKICFTNSTEYKDSLDSQMFGQLHGLYLLPRCTFNKELDNSSYTDLLINRYLK